MHPLLKQNIITFDKLIKMPIGEIAVYRILYFYNIPFEMQKRFKDCKNQRTLPFDFYLPKHNTLIEVDEFHHFGIKHKSHIFDIDFDKVKQNDSIKNKYCSDNYIRLIRIRYDELYDIKNILKSNGIIDVTFNFTPKDYDAIDEEFRPIFTLKPWRRTQIEHIAQAANNEAKAIKLIVSQIVSFENLFNLDGEKIEFSADLKLEEILPKKILLSILNEIARISGLSKTKKD